MTPPNELEQLAEFQDAIQSDEGLERLRAMQYLQQMNNQGIMGLPQVTQQPVVQRSNGGNMFESLGHTVDNIRENLTTEDLSAATYIAKRGGSNEDRLIAQQIIGIFNQTNPELVDEMFQAEQDEIDYEKSETRREMIEGVQDKIGGGLENIQEILGARTGRAYGGPIIERAYSGSIGTGGLIGRTPTGISIWNKTQEGITNKGIYGGIHEDELGIDALPRIATGNLANLESVQSRGGIYNAGEFKDANMSLDRPSNAPMTVIQEGQPQTSIRDYAGNIPYDLYQAQPINTFGQDYDLKDTDYFTANQLALNEGTDRFIYNDEYAAVDPGLLSNYDYSNLGTKPYADPVGPLSGVSYSGDAEKLGNFNLPQNPNSPAAMKAQGYKMGPTGQFIKDTSTYTPLTDYERNVLGMKYRAGGGIVQGRELQQLREGGLVDLPVVKMGFGGFLGNIFSSITKPIRKVVKSKTFKALAPLVLAVAAPYALGALAPSVFGAGATALGGALSTTGALGYGLATGLGSLAGNLLSGAKFGDAAKQAILSGATAGAFKGFGSGNWMGTGTGGTGAAGTIGQKGYSKTGSALMDQSKNLPGYGPASNKAPIAPDVGTKYYGGPTAASQPTKLVYDPVQQGTTTNFSGAEKMGGPGTSSFTPDPTIVEPRTITPTAQVDLTPSTWDTVKGIGQDIWKDYGNWKGAAKLVGMDMMQPDWDQVYASEASMEDQLRKMGYDIVDTGYGTQRVIRDPSGVTLPSNLSVQDILDRALGRTPRTRLSDRIGFEPNASEFVDKAQGGLVSLAGGGEFSGKVEGDGHGMEDNVYMPIVEKERGKQIGTLAVSPSEYVVDAHTMSALGNGNPDEGAKVMDTVIESVRKKAYGTVRQPNEIDGLNALMPMMQGV